MTEEARADMFEALVLNKCLHPQKLLAYGFILDDEKYRYHCDIMDGAFRLQIAFDLSGKPATTLIDRSADEEYILYKTSAQGAYVGRVRQAVTDVMQQIINACFVPVLYQQPQTMQLLEYVKHQYGDTPDYPFHKGTPDTGILRRANGGKWYAVIMKIPRRKLGLPENEIVEVVNLHASEEQVKRLLDRPHFYPGWHMNKKYWYTVILDGSVDSKTLFLLMDESYQSIQKTR